MLASIYDLAPNRGLTLVACGGLKPRFVQPAYTCNVRDQTAYPLNVGGSEARLRNFAVFPRHLAAHTRSYRLALPGVSR